MKIYLGCDRRRFANEIEYPMISFRTMQKRRTGLVFDREWFMDSGAFTLLRQFGKYPFSYGEYLRSVKKFKPTYFANMDWCCEPDIVKATKLSVLHHISHTVENGRQLIDFDRDKFVMVLQGWTIRDYFTCIDYVKDYGLFTPVLGVGTMCCRKNPTEVFNLLKNIKANIPDWCKLHCFGFSIDMLKFKEVYDLIDSIDTYAWCREFGLNKNGVTEVRIEVLKEYIKKINAIVDKNDKQHLLEIQQRIIMKRSEQLTIRAKMKEIRILLKDIEYIIFNQKLK